MEKAVKTIIIPSLQKFVLSYKILGSYTWAIIFTKTTKKSNIEYFF